MACSTTFSVKVPPDLPEARGFPAPQGGPAGAVHGADIEARAPKAGRVRERGLGLGAVFRPLACFVPRLTCFQHLSEAGEAGGTLVSPSSAQSPGRSQRDSCLEPAHPLAPPCSVHGPRPSMASSCLSGCWGPGGRSAAVLGRPWSMPFTLQLVKITENIPLTFDSSFRLVSQGVL